MKKTLITLSLVLMSAIFVYGQTAQGTFYLGGSFNLGFGSTKYKTGSTSTDGPKTFNFGINPKVGYFVSDNFSIGLGIGFDMQSVKTKNGNNEEKVTTSSFYVGPGARYYIMPAKNMGFFFEGSLGVVFGSTKDEVTAGGTTTTDKLKLSGFQVAVTPGLVIFVSDKVALEATFGGLVFSTQTQKTDNGDPEHKTTNSNFGLEINPATFTFGVAVHL